MGKPPEGPKGGGIKQLLQDLVPFVKRISEITFELTLSLPKSVWGKQGIQFTLNQGEHRDQPACKNTHQHRSDGPPLLCGQG